MTLWSRLNTCLRMKLVGAPCCTACADISCIVPTSNEMNCFVQIKRGLLQRRLLFYPVVVVFLRHHLEIRLHVVVTEAAKLSTDDLVLANFGSREMYGKIQARNEILLHAQFGNIEGVSDILRVHQQMDFTVHGNGHLCGYDVIFGILIVSGIDTEEVCRGFINLVPVYRAELTVRTGIAKVKRKLSRLHLDRYRVRGGRSEIHTRPCFGSEHTKS